MGYFTPVSSLPRIRLKSQKYVELDRMRYLVCISSLLIILLILSCLRILREYVLVGTSPPFLFFKQDGFDHSSHVDLKI